MKVSRVTFYLCFNEFTAYRWGFLQLLLKSETWSMRGFKETNFWKRTYRPPKAKSTKTFSKSKKSKLRPFVGRKTMFFLYQIAFRVQTLNRKAHSRFTNLLRLWCSFVKNVISCDKQKKPCPLGSRKKLWFFECELFSFYPKTLQNRTKLAPW